MNRTEADAANGEATHMDLKADMDVRSEKARLELAKDVMAMANSGGGKIRIGYTATEAPGVGQEVVSFLDGARVSDLVNKYVSPTRISVGHEIQAFGEGRFGVVLIVEGIKRYPAVVSREGQARLPSGKTVSVFEPGDIYFRHGAKTEKCTYEDLVDVFERTRQDLADTLKDYVSQLVRLPEGERPVLMFPGTGRLADPNLLVDQHIARRVQSRTAMLNREDLLWVFRDRGQIRHTFERLDMVIRSALRRPPTLYWWLASDGVTPGLVKQCLFDLATTDTDRDRSDARGSVLDVASFFLDDKDLAELVERLRQSEYAHLRKSAETWQGSVHAVTNFEKRAAKARLDDRRASEASDQDLQAEAAALSTQLLDNDSSAVARRLTDLGRVWFLRRRGRS